MRDFGKIKPSKKVTRVLVHSQHSVNVGCYSGKCVGLACLPDDEAENQSGQCLLQCPMVIREDELIPSDSVLFTSPCRLTFQMLFSQWLGHACQFG